MVAAVDNRAVSVDHYENFPVASVLCPPAIRPAVVAIYRFARTADDLADEGSADADERLRSLADYRLALDRAMLGDATGSRWPEVFGPLARAAERHSLPPRWLHALLDAFEQDARNPTYRDRAQLLAYCQLSANPVGRLMLHLIGHGGQSALERSDAVCTALQLINFWQDLGIDQQRGRNYLPIEDLARHGLPDPGVNALADGPALRRLMAELCEWARSLMVRGAPLAMELPGRAGWELRLVVQGGLAILGKIRRAEYACLRVRPTLGWYDAPLLAWRAWSMSGGVRS